MSLTERSYACGTVKPRRVRRRFLTSLCLAVCLWPFGGLPSGAAAAQTSARDLLREKFEALESKLPAQPPLQAADRRHWARARLHLRKARFVLDHYRPGQWAAQLIREEVNGFVDALMILAGEATPLTGPGFFEAAYWCDLDGSAQPFVGHVPRSYDGRTVHPLLVFLHGYSPYLNIINWSTLSTDLLAAAEDGGFLVAAPFGRGNTDFQGIGERDVLLVIEEMQQRYKVDADRIFLVGYSMGGMGAWTLGAHYPHMFAGALIVSGRACYYTWHGTARDSLPYYRRAFVDMEFGRSLLPNLRNLPILCYHGGDDVLIPVREARIMAAALRPLNPDFRYVEIEGGNHWIFDRVMRKPETRQWLATQRRRQPETFSYVSWHPRYRRAHWLSLAPEEAAAGISRRLTVSAADNGWTVNIEPPGRAYLHTDSLPAAVTPPAVRAAPGVELIAFNAGGAFPEPPPRGPLKEFFLAPFMLVRAGDKHDGLSAGLEFEKRCREWEQYAQAPPRRARESLLGADQLRDYNLLLFGEPENSPMIRAVLETSPVTVTDEQFIVGQVAVPRAGNGLLMIYRSPWNSRRLAAVQCGIPWGQNLSSNHRYDYVPDVIVYTAESEHNGSNRALTAGFFDPAWQLETGTLYRAPDTMPLSAQPGTGHE